MTEDHLRLEVTSSDGGLENTIKIRTIEDLELAVAALETAGEYEFEETVELSEQEDQYSPTEDIVELREDFDDLESQVEALVEAGGEEVGRSAGEPRDKEEESDSDSDSHVEDIIQEQNSEKLESDDAVSSEEEHVDESEGDPEAESPNEDDESSESKEGEEEEDEHVDESEELDLSSRPIPEIVEQGLVEVYPPYSYSEFKDLSYTEQQAVIYRKVLEIQPATKEEVTEELLDGDGSSAQVQYVYQRLDDLHDNGQVDRNRRPSDSPRDPYEYAEEGFDFEAVSSSEAADGEETEESKGSGKEDETDPGEDSGDGAYGFEWKTIDEAIEEYKDDRSTKFLLCIETMSSFTSPISAENHADDEDAEVWTASEELPDDFVK